MLRAAELEDFCLKQAFHRVGEELRGVRDVGSLAGVMVNDVVDQIGRYSCWGGRVPAENTTASSPVSQHPDWWRCWTTLAENGAEQACLAGE